MSWLERLKEKKKKMQDQMKRGRVVTEQKRAARLRKKSSKVQYHEPGTIGYGLMHKQNPLDLMKDVKQRREEKRKHR